MCFEHIRQLYDIILHIRNIGKRRHSIYLCYQIPFSKFLHSLVSTEVNKSSLCDESETFRFMPTSPACPHVNSGKPLLFPPVPIFPFKCYIVSMKIFQMVRECIVKTYLDCVVQFGLSDSPSFC